MIDPDSLSQLDALQLKYIRSLDRRDMQGWLACFDVQASYVCIARENQSLGLPLALMMDDSSERLRDRVKFVTEVWAGTFEEYSTRHIVQRLSCTPTGSSSYCMESSFVVAYTSARGESQLLVMGEYHDDVVIHGDGAKFKQRKAVLDTATTPRYLVYPV